jgi:hypothetical protein
MDRTERPDREDHMTHRLARLAGVVAASVALSVATVLLFATAVVGCAVMRGGL